jgi:predicted deacylase
MNSHTMHRIDLPALGPGSPLFIVQHTFDGGVTTKSAYIQAGLHANEQPGLLVANHLLKILAKLDSESKILGRVVVVPYANPIGLSQKVLGEFPGRFYLQDGVNFDRSFPAIDASIREDVAASSYDTNDIDALRKLIQSQMTKVKALDPAAFMKKTLLQEAFKHDVVIDLHCAHKSVLFVMGKSEHASRVGSLAESVRARAVILEDRLAGSPMDESMGDAPRIGLSG